MVLQTTKYLEALNWYCDHLGMIVSDFLYYRGRRNRGPVMSFIRCDRGQTPADHHTLAIALGPSNRYIHSAYQVSDIDAMGAGVHYLAELGYHRSWGIGRHIQGSQIFDYWRDPDGSWSSTTATVTCLTARSSRVGLTSPRPGSPNGDRPSPKTFSALRPAANPCGNFAR